MLICGLSLIGLPLTAGFISKIYLIRAVLNEGYLLITGVIVISSALSVIYLWKIIEVMWMRPIPTDSKYQPESVWIYAPIWVLAIANIVFGINAEPVVTLARGAAHALIGVAP